MVVLDTESLQSSGNRCLGVLFLKRRGRRIHEGIRELELRLCRLLLRRSIYLVVDEVCVLIVYCDRDL